MNRQRYSDQQLISSIVKGGEERNQTIEYLFHHDSFQAIVTDTVVNAGGNKDYGKTVFKDCIIQLDKIVRRKKYTFPSLEQFFEQVAKQSWCRMLLTDTTARDHVISFLSVDKELKGKIKSTIVRNSGSEDDANDIFQNGLLLINDHLKEGKFRGGAVKGFFYQVCYNLWRNELKKHKMQPLPDDGMDVSVTFIDPQIELERKERAILLDQVFQQLGESCQKILRLKFLVIDQYTMEEIAVKMGFKNAQIASNTLSKCRKKLWKLLQEHKSEFSWISRV